MHQTLTPDRQPRPRVRRGGIAPLLPPWAAVAIGAASVVDGGRALRRRHEARLVTLTPVASPVEVDWLADCRTAWLALDVAPLPLAPWTDPGAAFDDVEVLRPELLARYGTAWVAAGRTRRADTRLSYDVLAVGFDQERRHSACGQAVAYAFAFAVVALTAAFLQAGHPVAGLCSALLGVVPLALAARVAARVSASPAAAASMRTRASRWARRRRPGLRR